MTLRVTGLEKTFPGPPQVTALAGVSLEIAAGKVRALIGPNGAGKTTLVSIVMGLTEPDAGSVCFEGTDLLGPGGADARRRIGYAPQEEALYPIMTGRENLRLFGELRGLRGRDLRAEIDEVVDGFMISDVVDRAVNTLSGGQRRRIHNAVALLGDSRLLLLDEPTAGVDPATREAILDVVGRRASERGAAVCYSTHYLPEVGALGAEVTLLDRGRVIAEGSLTDLLQRHGTSAIELRFDGDPPTLGGIPERVEVLDRTVRVHVGDPGASMGRIVGLLEAHLDRLAGVEVIRPDLDSVFLTLTGRRYGTEYGTGGGGDAT